MPARKRQDMTVLSESGVTIKEESFLTQAWVDDAEPSAIQNEHGYVLDMPVEPEPEPEPFPWNEGQLAALDGMTEHLMTRDGPAMAVLTGYAGTGKTTVLRELLYRVRSFQGNIHLMGPTHKSVGVIARAMAEDHRRDRRRPAITTAHSALRLRPKKVKDQQIFVPSRQGPRIPFRSIACADEASMYGSKKPDRHGNQGMMEHFEDLVTTRDVRMVLVGDPAQLPPVGEKNSRAFDLEKRFHLSEVMRQAGDSPVLDLCTAIRKQWEAKNFVLPPIQEIVNESGASGVYGESGQYRRWLPDAFEIDGRFDENPDAFRVVAWRNVTVEKMNRHIQRLRYGKMSVPFETDERIIVRDPVMASACPEILKINDEDEILVRSQSEGNVISVTESEHHIRPEYKVYLVEVMLDAEEIPITLNVIHPESARDFDREGSRLKARAIAASAGKLPKEEYVYPGEAWSDWYRHNELMANLRCAYAMTVHSSQGSTFEHVFVDLEDIQLNKRNREEMIQLAYVGCSRASQNLIINL